MGRTRKILLKGVVISIILYGANIWYKACEIAKHRESLLSTERQQLLRITYCVYSGTSGYSLGVPHRPSGTGKGTPIQKV